MWRDWCNGSRCTTVNHYRYSISVTPEGWRVVEDWIEWGIDDCWNVIDGFKRNSNFERFPWIKLFNKICNFNVNDLFCDSGVLDSGILDSGVLYSGVLLFHIVFCLNSKLKWWYHDSLDDNAQLVIHIWKW